MSSERVNALRQVLEATPDNHTIRLLLADTLLSEGEQAEAFTEYSLVHQANALPRERLLEIARLALSLNHPEVAVSLVGAARQSGIVEGVSALQSQIDAKLEEQGVVRLVLPGAPPSVHINDYLDSRAPITFADIGGLEEVKKVIHRLIILPLSRPELYQKYKKQSGGGVLLYGPPGCGKTMLARATAGECGLPFFNLRIEEIIDPYMGVSERNLHEAFMTARNHAPCVLFLDEVDAIAFARRKQSGSHGRALVDQLLQELDAIGADNQQLLILAATNAPWDVDDALMRPGRFDRRIFVPPPDEPARQRVLDLALAELPQQGIDTRQLAKNTSLFSGADLRALVDHATDLVIEEVLDGADAPPLTMRHFQAALTNLRPTTLEWLARVRNVVEFANHDDRYNEVAEFLKSREVRSWKGK